MSHGGTAGFYPAIKLNNGNEYAFGCEGALDCKSNLAGKFGKPEAQNTEFQQLLKEQQKTGVLLIKNLLLPEDTISRGYTVFIHTFSDNSDDSSE